MTERTFDGKTCGLALLTAMVLTNLATPLMAQGRQATCASRDMVVTRLAERYGESRQAVGLGANNGVVEVFASDETGTWTITVTMPNGMTCLVASGQAFEALSEEIAADSDA